MRIVLFLLFGCVLSSAAHAIAPSAPPTKLKAVIMSGLAFPGEDLFVFPFGSGPVLSARGDIALDASISLSPGQSSMQSILKLPIDGPLERLVSINDQVPGEAVGVQFYRFHLPVSMNAEGQVNLVANITQISPSVSQTFALLREQPELEVVMRQGQALPSLGPNVFIDRGVSIQPRHSTNGSGQVVQMVSLTGSQVTSDTNSAIIRTNVDGTVDVIARSGDAAVGLPSGVVWNRMAADTVELPLNDQGTIVFRPILSGAEVTESNNSAMYLMHESGDAQLIAREGDSIIAGDSSVLFGDLTGRTTFTLVGLNNQHSMAFVTPLTGPGTNSSNDLALFRSDSAGEIHAVARRGQTVPGTSEQYYTFDDPRVNSVGQIAFGATLRDSSTTPSLKEALFVTDTAGSPAMIVKAGDPAPGTDNVFQSFGGFSFNARGQVLFFARLAGAPPGANDLSGLWAWDPVLGTELVVHRGLDLDFEDLSGASFQRLVTSIGIAIGTGGEDGRNGRLNDDGSFAFSARFSDGSSAAFISRIHSVPSIPEPRGYAIIALSLVVGWMYRQCERRK
ncbi:DUF7453 family protein [Aeoliella sp. SH292]|uniref:DUF7453 family protein n=1 Tax=Aeoliella sp. SH292 TaxID=3454464 RepID=UPI003F9788EC